MEKEIKIKLPTSYSDITLQKYLDLQNDLKNYADDEEAVSAAMLMHLCGLDPKYIRGLALDDYNLIRETLKEFIENVELPLQRFIKIDDVEYGFEPNLSKMAYGAFADITKYNEIAIDENWANIMSILYRPVERKKGDMYSIKVYNGEIDKQKFLNVGMDVHFGALFFLLNLLMDLMKDILNSTMEMELPPNIKSILARSGGLIQPLSSWHKGISLK